jgi:hypothetical protein
MSAKCPRDIGKRRETPSGTDQRKSSVRNISHHRRRSPLCLEMRSQRRSRRFESAHLHSSDKRVLTLEPLQPEDSGMRVRYRLLFRQQHAEPSICVVARSGVSLTLRAPMDRSGGACESSHSDSSAVNNGSPSRRWDTGTRFVNGMGCSARRVRPGWLCAIAAR